MVIRVDTVASENSSFAHNSDTSMLLPLTTLTLSTCRSLSSLQLKISWSGHKCLPQSKDCNFSSSWTVKKLHQNTSILMTLFTLLILVISNMSNKINSWLFDFLRLWKHLFSPLHLKSGISSIFITHPTQEPR